MLLRSFTGRSSDAQPSHALDRPASERESVPHGTAGRRSYQDGIGGRLFAAGTEVAPRSLFRLDAVGMSHDGGLWAGCGGVGEARGGLMATWPGSPGLALDGTPGKWRDFISKA